MLMEQKKTFILNNKKSSEIELTQNSDIVTGDFDICRTYLSEILKPLHYTII